MRPCDVICSPHREVARTVVPLEMVRVRRVHLKPSVRSCVAHCSAQHTTMLRQTDIGGTLVDDGSCPVPQPWCGAAEACAPHALAIIECTHLTTMAHTRVRRMN